MLKYIDAGESHGYGYVGIIDGMPAGLEIDTDSIDKLLTERQDVYGRGKRMGIERDHVLILSGVRGGISTGSPIGLMIKNKDYENWKEYMYSQGRIKEGKEVTVPRPGHADLAGMLKYGLKDARDIIERASARETVMRTAAGGIALQLLNLFGIGIRSHVIRIGRAASTCDNLDEAYWDRVETSPVKCGDISAQKEMICEIDRAEEMGDTVGGVVQVVAMNVPAGLGSHTVWQSKLDARLCAACMSVQAVKGVEVGAGFKTARRLGSRVHDEIYYGSDGFYRKTNNAGGIEGGISNGENIILNSAVKPIPTLTRPLKSVDVRTKNPAAAQVERSDICAVPAAAVILKAVIAWVMAAAFLDKFAGNSMDEVKNAYDYYMARVSKQ
jgi:chorismate synthase